MLRATDPRRSPRPSEPTPRNPYRRLAPVPHGGQMLHDSAPRGRFRHWVGPSLQVEVASLDVDHQAGIGAEVRQPVAWARRTRDVEAAIDVEHPDLDAARFPRP